MTTKVIPPDATHLQQDAFRAVWTAINSLGKKDINMHGHRITNGGQALGVNDFVTLGQLRRLSKDHDVVREIRSITENSESGGGRVNVPWVRENTRVYLFSNGDRVGIGLSVFPSAVPKVHIREVAAASFPTLAASDYLVLENSGNTSISIITGAAADGRLKFFGSGDAASDGEVRYNRSTRAMTFSAAATSRVSITATGSVTLANAGAIATNATDGFVYIPSCAGTPTGVPTAQTGMVPMVYDSTNFVLYVYAGGAWKTH